MILTTVTLGFGQKSNATTLNESNLTGTWILKLNPNQTTVTYTRESNSTVFGSKITFLENGAFINSVIPPCGNDLKLHHQKGNWKLDTVNLVLEIEYLENTTIPRKYKIMAFDSNKLTLLELREN